MLSFPERIDPPESSMLRSSPERSITVWGASLAAGLAIALVAAGENYLTGIMVEGKSFEYLLLFRWSIVFWGGWAVLTPAIVGMASRNLLNADSWIRPLIRLLAGAILFWMLHTLIESSAMRLIPDYRDLHGASFGGAFVAHLRRSWHINLLIVGGVVAVSQGVAWYLRYREQETDAARLKAAVAEAEIHAMKMQLHPHFLFNALHSISTLMHRDVQTADRMLIRVSDVLRETIDASRTDYSTLDEEISFLEKYLEVEKIRFRDRLTVDIDVPDDLRATLVPNLILQPLVENAIRHGFEPRSERFHLWIRAQRESDGRAGDLAGDRLVLEIEDNGAGLPPSGSIEPGVGLTVTRERLHLLYDERASVNLIAREGGGVIARVWIPLE